LTGSDAGNDKGEVLRRVLTMNEKHKNNGIQYFYPPSSGVDPFEMSEDRPVAKLTIIPLKHIIVSERQTQNE